ncbi:MAG: prolipoprotein diacylglyceryl transferase [Patescibacteria group bacterium]
MIPYISWQTINLGPITIQVWGMMVSLGVLSAMAVMYQIAKQRKFNANKIVDFAFWVLASALIGGRVFFIISEASYYIHNPLSVFKIWEGGMSISGGFVFALIAGYLFCRKNKINFWQYAGLTVFALPLGLFIGRLGCFFIYDHPGKPTTFFLGERYLDGIIRHNHGLYLSLNGLILFSVFLILHFTNKKRSLIIYPIIFLYEYAIVRFSLDFWRIADPLFFGLTIAQYLCIIMLISAIYLTYSNFFHKAKKI